MSNVAFLKDYDQSLVEVFDKAEPYAPMIAFSLKTASGSTAQPHIDLGDMRKRLIPLPRLNEQFRIISFLTKSDSRQICLKGLFQEIKLLPQISSNQFSKKH